MFNSDVQYVAKYRNTPGVLGYDTAMLLYRYFYKLYNLTIEAFSIPVLYTVSACFLTMQGSNISYQSMKMYQ